MASNTFVVGTRIDTEWLNDVDALVWDVFGGATSVATAKTALGLTIGTDVQAYSAQTAAIAALTPTDGNIIVGNGTTWVAESGATARTSLGLGTANTPDFAGITLGGVGSTLANYAEGTFTPTIQDDTRSDSESATYGHQFGRFTRIGNCYFISLSISVSSLGTLTGAQQAVIANIPVAAKSEANSAHSFAVGYASGINITANQSISAKLNSAEQVIELYCWDATSGPTILTLTELSATGLIQLSGHYFV